MDKHSLPGLMISIYKGEGRVLVVPYIHHVAGYSVFSDWIINIRNLENYLEIGKAVRNAINYIKESSDCTDDPGETDFLKTIKENSKYKDEIKFFKNNLLTRVKVFDDDSYLIYSVKFSEAKNRYSDIIEEIELSATASDEEIGKAVLYVFRKVEEL